MKIVCAASVLFGREAFETLGPTVVIPDQAISPHDVKDADALIVRSKTAVTAKLIENAPLQFVGTATAGFDHMDIEALERADIAWCAAPGCNANSVAEYVVAALLCLAARHRLTLEDLTVGVVGVGQVGSRVASKAEALGMSVLRNDPPLAMTSEALGFVSLDEICEKADVLTLHVPLTRGGPFPTWRLANSRLFSRVKPGCIFLNAARGEVVDPDGLLFAIEHGAVRHAVLDVWNGEPGFSPDLLNRIDLGTPHIAGWSFEGRLNGTLAVYREACHFFEMAPAWEPDEDVLPRAPTITLDAAGKSDEQVLGQAVRAAYDIEADDRALRQGSAMNEAARGVFFDSLRRSYHDRREFPASCVSLAGASDILRRKLTGIGFRIETAPRRGGEAGPG